MLNGLLQILIYLIIIDALLSYFPDVRNQDWFRPVHRFVNSLQKPIRDLLPGHMPFDPSPMILIIIIQILMQFL
jgi:uncharacterized protein YggT (Ycf19 family)